MQRRQTIKLGGIHQTINIHQTSRSSHLDSVSHPNLGFFHQHTIWNTCGHKMQKQLLHPLTNGLDFSKEFSTICQNHSRSGVNRSDASCGLTSFAIYFSVPAL